MYYVFGYYFFFHGEWRLPTKVVVDIFPCIFRVFFVLEFYLFIWQREQESTSRQSSRGRGRSRLPTEQGARCGAQSQDPGIKTWAEGSHLTNGATQAPHIFSFKKLFWYCGFDDEDSFFTVDYTVHKVSYFVFTPLKKNDGFFVSICLVCLFILLFSIFLSHFLKISFFKKDIYLFIWQGERERQGEREHKQREW